MRIIKSEKGVALVLVLVLSLIGLAMVSALLFMVTQGTTLSGAARFYRTAEEAAVGVAEITGDYIANRGVSAALGKTDGCDCGDPTDYEDNLDLDASSARTARCDKICNPSAQYNAGAGLVVDEDTVTAGLQVFVNPASNSDGTTTLGNYTVFYKIIDTVEGNTDTGGYVSSGALSGSGVVASTGGVYNPPHIPYIYRVEVEARQTTNPIQRSRMSMLYGF